VVALIPFNVLVFYPFLERLGIKVTSLRERAAGFFAAGLAFGVVADLQGAVDAGQAAGTPVHIGWQFLPYIIMTQAEVLLSITGLEFAYTQAPPRMKSTVMGFWLLTISVGNVLTAFLTKFSGLELQNFFWLFTGLVLFAGVIFAIRARFYEVRNYTQGDEAEATAEAASV
jgi:proton-dependent oligopeptide transporter, POT family